MKNRLLSVLNVKPILSKIFSMENIFSNYWVLVYPMQAIPAILFQVFSKWFRRKRAVVAVVKKESFGKFPLN